MSPLTSFRREALYRRLCSTSLANPAVVVDVNHANSGKQYIEQINVSGITFMYTEEGVPKGLCKARKLYYVTTAGGVFFPQEFGFGYVKSLAENFYGIGDVELVKAVGLDIAGADPDKIVKEAIKALG